MTELGEELAGSTELLASEGLADPSQAKTIRVKDGIPVPTDGPFAEAKESLAGYYLVEADEERAIEIGSEIVAAIGEPVEVRQVMDAPPEEYTS
ncbi:MAG: YciI family protein [Actinomycetota bacterium]